jgi:hypothetical protein
MIVRIFLRLLPLLFMLIISPSAIKYRLRWFFCHQRRVPAIENMSAFPRFSTIFKTVVPFKRWYHSSAGTIQTVVPFKRWYHSNGGTIQTLLNELMSHYRMSRLTDCKLVSILSRRVTKFHTTRCSVYDILKISLMDTFFRLNVRICSHQNTLALRGRQQQQPACGRHLVLKDVGALSEYVLNGHRMLQLKTFERGSQVELFAKFLFLPYNGRALCYLYYQNVPSYKLRGRLV